LYNTVHDSAAVAEGVHSFPIPQLYKMKRNKEIGLFTKPSTIAAMKRTNTARRVRGNNWGQPFNS